MKTPDLETLLTEDEEIVASLMVPSGYQLIFDRKRKTYCVATPRNNILPTRHEKEFDAVWAAIKHRDHCEGKKKRLPPISVLKPKKKPKPLGHDLIKYWVPCHWCGGSGTVALSAHRKETKECPPCGGAGEMTVFDLFHRETEDGVMYLAEKVGPMYEAGMVPEWWELLPPPWKDRLVTLLHNPCLNCHSRVLEKDWIGSAFCSKRCAIEYAKTDWEYVELVLKTAKPKD